MKVTTAILLETRITDKDKSYPVKIRVTYNRKCHYYTLRNTKNESIYLSESDYAKVMGDRPRDKYKELRQLINANEVKAANVIKDLAVFTFHGFESKFFGKTVNNTDVISSLKNKAEKLRGEGRISTARGYECSLNSLVKHIKKEYLEFESVSVPFLNDYEKSMLNDGNSPTTVGIYLRNLRAIFNEAVRNGNVKMILYPFGKDKYVIPNSRNVKKAITHKEVGLIANYPVIDGTSTHRYRDYWLFSFLCNGINIKDLAFLKYSNISGDVLTFVRAKTQRETKGNQKPITLVIEKGMGKIIDMWGNKPGLPDTYVFPIMEKGLTPEQQYNRIQQTTKLINKYVGEIAEALEIKNKVTSYTARHSFATVLKRSGAPLAFISESLGHSSITTTENYLADFEIEVKRKWAKKLTQF